MCSLEEVLTVEEVALMWCKTRNGVLYHIFRGGVRWRWTASGCYLVDRRSVVELWGEPKWCAEMAVYEVLPSRR